MSGNAATQAKNKYNDKAYDQIPLRVKKGQREIIKAYAERQGMSLNSYVTNLIADDMGNELNIPKETDNQ